MLPDTEIRRAHAALLASLGGTVAALPARTGDLLEIGRLGPLPCWSLHAPPAVAATLARALARRGRPGLVLADDDRPSRRRMVAVSITPVRPAIVDARDDTALPLVRLRRVPLGGGLLATALAASEAIDVDAAGRRAFRALRAQLDTAVARLDGRIRRDVRHAWVLLQVTRLLFLRFVEAEGWLDGDDAFLRHAVDDALQRGGDPARRLLHPLFFGTLNREPAARSSRARRFGAIPFLNGGLFEPHPIERRHRWYLPVECWRDLFALVVEGIEVSLDQGDTGDRVNPELLGRVFEGVMDPAERRAAGTYYTPAALVPVIVRESYACHLAPRLGRDEAAVHARLDDPDPELAAALLEPRVLDPAVGSGAFLVGALQLARGPGAAAARTRHLVTRRLFGVDRNPAAVRLTELRLWLEVLRTMRGRPVQRVTPLPNLDTTIRAGDALLDPLAGMTLPRRLSRALATARRDTRTAHGADRRRAMIALRTLEREAMDRALHRSEQRLRVAIEELLEPGHAVTLFGERGSLPRGTTARLGELRRAVAALRRERRRLATGDAAPIFAIESAFAPELARGGFDLVLGNPPWVRAERLPAPERAALEARYRWWRGSGSGWQHRPDLSVAFVERAVELLAPAGCLGFLLPAKLATARYAATLRAGLAHRTTIHLAADLSQDPRAGFDATTYPMALIVSKGAAQSEHRVRVSQEHRDRATLQRSWRERGTWALGDGAVADIAMTLADQHPTLAAFMSLSLGLKTGANVAFLDPPDTLAPWTRPVLRGRDLAAGRTIARHRMLWPADDRGEPWSQLPEPVAAHLAPHRNRLQRRADLRDDRWWRFFRTGPATARWRVAWADLARRLRAHPLEDPSPVPLNSCYVIACPTREQMLVIAAWLSAAPIGALARLDAEPAANGYARFGARAVGSVPFPAAALDDPELRAAATDPTADVQDVARRVSALLGLDAAAVRTLDALTKTGR